MSMPGFAASCAAISLKSSVPKCREQQEHAEQEAEVADAVDDEGLLAGVWPRSVFWNQKPMSR